MIHSSCLHYSRRWLVVFVLLLACVHQGSSTDHMALRGELKAERAAAMVAAQHTLEPPGVLEARTAHEEFSSLLKELRDQEPLVAIPVEIKVKWVDKLQKCPCGMKCGETCKCEGCKPAGYCCKVDCKQGPWTPWTTCDKPCGPGFETRTRTTLVQAKLGGKACGPLEEKRACNLKPCGKPTKNQTTKPSATQTPKPSPKSTPTPKPSTPAPTAPATPQPSAPPATTAAPTTPPVIHTPTRKAPPHPTPTTRPKAPTPTPKCPGIEADLKKLMEGLLVKIHFLNGYEEYKLFDYHTDDGKKTKANGGGFTNEQHNFPKGFMPFDAAYQKAKKHGCKLPALTLYLSGFASIAGQHKPNMKLSMHRAQAVACYIREFMTRLGHKQFTFHIGYYGDSKSKGKSQEGQAGDRRVAVFFEAHEFKKNFKAHNGNGGGAIVWDENNSEMASYCAKKPNWQRKHFQDSYFSLRE